MKLVALLAFLATATPTPPAISSTDLARRLDRITADVTALSGAAPQQARAGLLRVYLDQYEALEGYYGSGSGQPEDLVARIRKGEAAFHAVLQAAPVALPAAFAALQQSLEAIRPALNEVTAVKASGPAVSINAHATGARTPEIQRVLVQLDHAKEQFLAGSLDVALVEVEQMYLEGVEPLESRLPAARVNRIERLIHLDLRPQLKRGADHAEVVNNFSLLRSELIDADRILDAGSSFWFGVANSFAILVREGLEAVLLVAALLAYLTAAGASSKQRRQIYWGVVAGCVATAITWIVARAVISIGGGSRELLEGVTGLVSVAVLLYVSNWLFQKTYIHDWKDYLKRHVGQAVTTGSAVAMAGLAFAAIYREGFETVLFYQALAFDAGTTAVLTGFVPGFLLIIGIGFGIIRMGVKLPLKRMFSVTNAILLYLAFVLVGKGFYNLQEAGLFAPHPIAWMPDGAVLRQLLGLYPILESVIAQLLFLILVAGTFVFYKRRIAVARTLRTA